VGGIEEHTDPQREVRLLAEKANLLLCVVVRNLEVALFQVRYQLVAAVENGRQHVNKVDLANKTRLLGVGRRRWLLLRRRLLRSALLSEARRGECEHRQACKDGQGREVAWAIHDLKV